jgi:multidrug efflux pump subunit AcrA (membrane-fusion protein)
VKPPPSLDSLSRLKDAPKAVRRIPSWSIPVGIVAGFALLFLALFRDRILPAPDVKVAAVLATSGSQGAKAPPEQSSAANAPAEGNMLFQASGWIEPDPLPIKAGALIDGVVDTVHVLEGGDVKKGDVLASLIQDDVRLALATAEQNRRTLTSTRKAHQAAIASARKKLEGAKAQETAASTMLDEAADRAKRLDGLPDGAVSESDIVSARLRREREESQVLTATLFTGELQAEIERMEFETQVKDDEIRTAEIEVEKAQLVSCALNPFNFDLHRY